MRTLSWLLSISIFVSAGFFAPLSNAWATTPFTSTQLCELEALTPEQIIERVAESYKNLLEFGGEAFSEARLQELSGESVSLEKYFALATTRDQHGVALNQSLDLLGDWVLLESEDHRVNPELLRERLRATIRSRAGHMEQERIRMDETRATRRDVDPFSDIPLPPGWGSARQIFSADDGKIAILRNENGQIVVLDLEKQRVIRDISQKWNLMDGQAVGQVFLAPHDRIVWVMQKTSQIHALNWRTGELQSWQDRPTGPGLSSLLYFSSSPSGRYLVIRRPSRGSSEPPHVWDLSAHEPQKIEIRFPLDLAPDMDRLSWSTTEDQALLAVKDRAGHEKGLYLWKSEDLLNWRRIPGHIIQESNTSVAFSPDLSQAVHWGSSRPSRLFELDERHGWIERPAPNTSMHTLALLRGWREMIYQESSAEGPLVFQNNETGETHRIGNPPGDLVDSLGLSPSERYCFFFTYNRDSRQFKLHVFDVTQRAIVGTSTNAAFAFEGVNARFSLDERYLLVPNQDSLRVFDLEKLRLDP